MTNLCVKGVMSSCSEKEHKDQLQCKFYEKSSWENKCMYYVMDGHCDNPAAQSEAHDVEFETSSNPLIKR